MYGLIDKVFVVYGNEFIWFGTQKHIFIEACRLISFGFTFLGQWRVYVSCDGFRFAVYSLTKEDEPKIIGEFCLLFFFVAPILM